LIDKSAFVGTIRASRIEMFRAFRKTGVNDVFAKFIGQMGVIPSFLAATR
jgi:hypothetical protein